MKKIVSIFITLSICLGVQTQDVRKLSIDSDIINLESGQSYKITPNTTGASYEIFKGETSQGVFSYTKTINTIVGLKLNQTTLSLGLEEPFELTAKIVPTQTVTYESSDPTVAVVHSTTGAITGKKAGTATITATSTDMQTATCVVTVKTLAERFADVAGTTATIVVYGNEIIPAMILVNVDNSVITLTTPDNTERILKKTEVGSLIRVGAASISAKVILDGYVNLKGLATAAYGGTDEIDNNNSLVLIQNGGILEMKGHSKITGNAFATTKTSGTHLGGGITSNASTLIIAENSEISGHTIVNLATTGNCVVYAGAVYASGGATVEIKDNAKVCGNNALNNSGNAYGGAFFPEASSVTMTGGEVSGNIVSSKTGIAGGGSFQMASATARFYFKGGVIKENTLKYSTYGRGGAVNVGNSSNTFIISDSAYIPYANNEITVVEGLKVDTRNTTYQQTGYAFSIWNPLTAPSPVAVLDLDSAFPTGSPVIRSYDGSTFAPYTDNAPADKFGLGNRVLTSTPFTLTPMTNKEIKPDGKVGDK